MSGPASTTSSEWASTSCTCRRSIPIGRTARKGRDSAVVAEATDVGSPWAIGAVEGGHTAIHPELGTIDDFRDLLADASRRGIEVALDLAFQASPDHPWVREHPSWFRHSPDGTIRHAENPPKKYEDIYPFDFESLDWPDLWAALLDVVRFWVDQGVRIFRVDNPHTKPFAFWEWLIACVRADEPEVIFLAEAFTRPRVMEHLARIGFSQSYTYFTWRTTKWELETYLSQLTAPGTAAYFRPNLWPNTPDILPDELVARGSGRPSWPAWCSRPRCRRATESTVPSSSCRNTSRGAKDPRSTCAPRSTRSARGTSTAPRAWPTSWPPST